MALLALINYLLLSSDPVPACYRSLQQQLNCLVLQSHMGWACLTPYWRDTDQAFYLVSSYKLFNIVTCMYDL